jgi:hypothetical protein
MAGTCRHILDKHVSIVKQQAHILYIAGHRVDIELSPNRRKSPLQELYTVPHVHMVSVSLFMHPGPCDDQVVNHVILL